MTKLKENLSTSSPIEHWRFAHGKYLSQYTQGKSYVPHLLPQVAIQLNIFTTLHTLKDKLGNELFFQCIDFNSSVPSKESEQRNGNWLKKTNMVGVNVRTVGNFFNVVKYAMTLCESQNSIHLLPIWEPGVVSSLYGKVSWNINPAFYSIELANALPQLNSVEKQLKVTINLLHAMGKTVGMDVIPHCDRFAEMVISRPYFFEWVHQQEGEIKAFSVNLHNEVIDIIWQYLLENGAANNRNLEITKDDFFDLDSSHITEDEQLEIIFGYPSDVEGRKKRRIKIMCKIVEQGYETLPMTMAPPYRGLHIDKNKYIQDELGNKWFTYEFNEPREMSRVFGPLTRYRFFDSPVNSWSLEFDRPIKPAWQYLAHKYADCQLKFGFDFMRGDMAHVQLRPQGVPQNVPDFYDPLAYIKSHIVSNQAPHFAFYAETFLAPDDVMSYGNEADHLNAIKAEATLGDLQSTALGSTEFREKLSKYLKLKAKNSFCPSFTIITSDKDDPRFDAFFRSGNVARYFMGQFLQSFPSYFSLGFETRGRNVQRAANETYSKLYVFTIHDKNEKDKFTEGPYKWPKNYDQFHKLEEIKSIQDAVISQLGEDEVLTNPLTSDCFVWKNKNFVFAVSFKAGHKITPDQLNSWTNSKKLDILYQHEGEFQCLLAKLTKERKA